MRILLVSQDFPPTFGGIQTFSVRVADALVEAGELVHVVAPAHPDAREADAALAFPVTRVPSRPDLLALGLLPRLPALLARERVDVVLHAQWPTALASLLARRLTGYPRHIAVALHGRELVFNPFAKGSIPARAYDGLRRQLLARADVLLPNSRFTAALAHSLDSSLKPVPPIGMGVDAEHFRPRDRGEARRQWGLSDGPVVLTVSRLVPRKGVAEVIAAVKHLAASRPALQYLVAGEGPERERLEALATRLGVADRVRFLGRVGHDDLPALYAACDVAVLAAKEDPVDVEGFGIVYLEASACERPVVGTRVGGIPDAIVDGETGFLIPPDDPDALVGALDRLLEEPALARRFGEQGRERVLEAFTWGHVADRVRAALVQARVARRSASS